MIVISFRAASNVFTSRSEPANRLRNDSNSDRLTSRLSAPRRWRGGSRPRGRPASWLALPGREATPARGEGGLYRTPRLVEERRPRRRPLGFVVAHFQRL